MDNNKLQAAIDAAWDKRDSINSATKGEAREAVDAALDGLDSGAFRVAEKRDGKWHTNQWLKKAVLLSFRLNDSYLMPGGGEFGDLGRAAWFDKVPSKFAGWDENRFQGGGIPRRARLRRAPLGLYRARRGADAELRQCRRRVDSGTMIDTWVTVGSCAQIGKNCHISGGAGIGGVLEPLQAGPVIIEDNCFIGARSEVVEGVVVEEGSVLSMGVYHRRFHQDRRPRHRRSALRPRARLLGGGVGHDAGRKPMPDGSPGPGLYCAVIVKRVDEKTRAKTSINELLRD